MERKEEVPYIAEDGTIGAWAVERDGKKLLVDAGGVDYAERVLGTWRTIAKHQRWSKYGLWTMEHIMGFVDGKVYHGKFGSDWSEAVILRPYKKGE